MLKFLWKEFSTIYIGVNPISKKILFLKNSIQSLFFGSEILLRTTLK